MSMVTMRQGKSLKMQYWMRARVVLQGLTIVAVAAGSMALQKKHAAAELAEPTEDEEKKRAREKAGFESRLREAEKVVENGGWCGACGASGR